MTKKQIFHRSFALLAGFAFCALILSAAATKSARVARIIQTNSAGDNVHIIDPVTNKVVGVIEGIEVNHGVAVAPDGTRIYISDEAQSTLDVVDSKTLKVIKRIPLSGHPNNVAVAPDGRRVYVGIIQAPGGVDVIDTASFEDLKTLPTKGSIHNPYVTPDGKYVVAGSIAGKTVNVIDTQTDQTAWTLQMDRASGRWPSTKIPMARPSGFSCSYRTLTASPWSILRLTRRSSAFRIRLWLPESRS